jgi:rRNA maturation endonuclease Nob1
MVHNMRPLARIQDKYEMNPMSCCWNCRRIFHSQDRQERLCEHCKQQESLLQYVEKPNKPQTRGGGIK